MAACCNFRKAASQLGLAPSTLSQTINALEDRLDVRLLNRTTRSVRLTHAGQVLQARLQPLLQELDHSVTEVSDLGNRPAGQVRLVTSRAGVRLALAPLLGRFCPAHSEIDLDIRVDDTITNIVEHELDAGVRVCQGHAGGQQGLSWRRQAVDHEGSRRQLRKCHGYLGFLSSRGFTGRCGCL